MPTRRTRYYAILFDMYYGGKAANTEKFAATEATPRFQDFFINNIVVQNAKRGIFVRGLPEMNVKNVSMENLMIQADTGMYSEEADGISIKNLTLLTKNTNPLIDLQNSKQISFDNLKFKPGTQLLMNISGGTSQNIRFINTDISKAKKDFLIAAGIPDSVVSKN